MPEYGGRAYLEKRDYILKKQNERIAEQKKELQEQSIQYVGLLEDCRNQRDENAELFNQTIRQSEEILKNNEKIKSQENELEELFSQWVDVNDLFNDAVSGSYDQAVLAVSDVGLNKALQEAVNEIDQHLEWLMDQNELQTSTPENMQKNKYSACGKISLGQSRAFFQEERSSSISQR